MRRVGARPGRLRHHRCGCGRDRAGAALALGGRQLRRLHCRRPRRERARGAPLPSTSRWRRHRRGGGGRRRVGCRSFTCRPITSMPAAGSRTLSRRREGWRQVNVYWAASKAAGDVGVAGRQPPASAIAGVVGVWRPSGANFVESRCCASAASGGAESARRRRPARVDRQRSARHRFMRFSRWTAGLPPGPGFARLGNVSFRRAGPSTTWCRFAAGDLSRRPAARRCRSWGRSRPAIIRRRRGAAAVSRSSTAASIRDVFGIEQPDWRPGALARVLAPTGGGSEAMKGIILAGGTGSRLWPMTQASSASNCCRCTTSR